LITLGFYANAIESMPGADALVNSEPASDGINEILDHYTVEFGAALRRVADSSSYASQIASLTFKVFSRPQLWKLWIERFGMLYGAFVLPSDLFPFPLRCRFRTDHWRTSRELPDCWEIDNDPATDSGTGALPEHFGFFTPASLKGGDLHIKFVAEFGNQDSSKSHNLSRNKIVVPEEFVKAEELLQIDYADDEAERDRLMNDLRLQRFLAYNYRALDYIFRASNPGWGAHFLRAIRELQTFTSQNSHHARHIYLYPGDPFESFPGVFCFAFNKKLTSSHKISLALISNGLFRFLRALDRTEFQRRTIPFHEYIVATHSELHSLRNTIGALGNKLQTLAGHDLCAEQPSTLKHVSDALELHAHVLHYLERIEALVTPTAQTSLVTPTARSYGSTVTIRKLLNMWREQWGHPEYIHLNVMEPKEESGLDNQIELPGPPAELGDALYQLLDGKLRDIQLSTSLRAGSADKSGNTLHLQVAICFFASSLWIRINGGSQFDAPIQLAMRNVTLLDRLPSLKPMGGRGILTAIALIRARYFATIELTKSPVVGQGWTVDIPITTLHQLSLLSDSSP